jgi:hypothetical protein
MYVYISIKTICTLCLETTVRIGYEHASQVGNFKYISEDISFNYQLTISTRHYIPYVAFQSPPPAWNLELDVKHSSIAVLKFMSFCGHCAMFLFFDTQFLEITQLSVLPLLRFRWHQVALHHLLLSSPTYS